MKATVAVPIDSFDSIRSELCISFILTASRRKFHFWRFHVSMRVAINKLFSLHADHCVGMQGKAADPCGFRDSQEWHKITIGFSESVLTGIYRRSPGAQTRLNEIARLIRGNLLVRILKKGNNGVRGSARLYILRAYTTGNIRASDKNAGWTLEFRYRQLGIISRKPLKYFLHYYSPAISLFLNFLILITWWQNSIAHSAFLH